MVCVSRFDLYKRIIILSHNDSSIKPCHIIKLIVPQHRKKNAIFNLKNTILKYVHHTWQNIYNKKKKLESN